jgi:hypothetical protein
VTKTTPLWSNTVQQEHDTTCRNENSGIRDAYDDLTAPLFSENILSIKSFDDAAILIRGTTPPNCTKLAPKPADCLSCQNSIWNFLPGTIDNNGNCSTNQEACGTASDVCGELNERMITPNGSCVVYHVTAFTQDATAGTNSTIDKYRAAAVDVREAQSGNFDEISFVVSNATKIPRATPRTRTKPAPTPNNSTLNAIVDNIGNCAANRDACGSAASPYRELDDLFNAADGSCIICNDTAFSSVEKCASAANHLHAENTTRLPAWRSILV